MDDQLEADTTEMPRPRALVHQEQAHILQTAALTSADRLSALAPSLTPFDTYVTITDALQRILAAGDSLRTITLVPVSLPPRRADRGPAPELLHFDDVTVQTYLTATDADQVST